MKYADFPFMVMDLYGRERHPEFTNQEVGDIESYSARRDRVELMMKTFSYVAQGVPPANRLILVDVDFVDMTQRLGSSTGTVVTAQYGQRPQGAWIIDLNGKIIQTQVWQDMGKNDEVLAAIFGLEAGGFTYR